MGGSCSSSSPSALSIVPNSGQSNPSNAVQTEKNKETSSTPAQTSSTEKKSTATTITVAPLTSDQPPRTSESLKEKEQAELKIEANNAASANSSANTASTAAPSASSSSPPASMSSSTAGNPFASQLSGFRLGVPLSVLTDSYKASHFLMYPEAQLMVAYGEFRAPFNKDKDDNRFVFYGIRYIIENYVAVQWTERDVEMADHFYKTHNAGFQAYPFPKDLFLKFVKENHGYFPVRIEALPEGTVANIHTPVYQIFAEKEYSRLATFLETILTQVWYPTTVATLSRRTRDLVDVAFEKSVDKQLQFLADSRLHDFGFRGCTCVEQSIIGGVAHLLNFGGSDTMSACFYAQYHLNNGKPIATSIPATEHSVMTSWPSEKLAIQNMIDKFGGEGKVFACVMDSYDYSNALNKVVPAVASDHKKKGGLMVLRPDSGDPVECVMEALYAGEKAFGSSVNSKGFKVLNGVNVIQGDGINFNTVKAILDTALSAGFAANNIAYGMGGGLLQKVNRDTMSFATKLSYIVYADGTARDIMKRPKTDGGKFSLPGILKVTRNSAGLLEVHPRGVKEALPHDSVLQCVYDHGPVKNLHWDDFDTIRKRVAEQWVKTPRDHDVVSKPLKDKIAEWIKNFEDTYPQMIAS